MSTTAEAVALSGEFDSPLVVAEGHLGVAVEVVPDGDAQPTWGGQHRGTVSVRRGLGPCFSVSPETARELAAALLQAADACEKRVARAEERARTLLGNEIAWREPGDPAAAPAELRQVADLIGGDWEFYRALADGRWHATRTPWIETRGVR